MKRLVEFLFWVGLTSILAAQGAQTQVSVVPTFTRMFTIPSAGGLSPVQIPIDHGDSIWMKLTVSQRPQSLTLKLPDGTTWDLLNGSDSRFSVNPVLPAEGTPGYPGAFYELTLQGVPTGSWELQPTYPASAAGATPSGTLQVVSSSSVASFLAAGKRTYTQGESVVLTTLTTRSGLAVGQITVDAKLAVLSDSTVVVQSVPFRDDGQAPDITSDDGVFTTALDGLTPGDYAVWAKIQGTTQDGPFERSCVANFSIRKVKVVLTGAFTEHPVVGSPR